MAYLLHGTLYAIIYEIDRLPISCCGLNIGGKSDGSKLYATIDLQKARVGRTRTIDSDTHNPRWEESFRIYCAHLVTSLIFTVKATDPIGATLIGRAHVPAAAVVSGGGRDVDGWYPLLDDRRSAPVRGNPKLHVRLRYLPVAADPLWSGGIAAAGGDFEGVPRAFFRQRRGCAVSLYQDAHIPTESIPKVILAGNGYHQNHRCWEDIFDAIEGAKHLIYVAGWSVYAKLELIRDPERRASDRTLGEILKAKAEEGVRVSVLVWDDRSSEGVLKKEGLMATHDEETESYFRNSKVRCVLCPRKPGRGRSLVQKVAISAIFTHHQKTVVVDAQATAAAAAGGGGGAGQEKKRTIVSFLGGIDLCDGRYDTPEHSLFRTLNTVHRKDFHQPNFAGASLQKGGPREPWHDIHCRLEGPVAWDVLYNFEQRWSKQVAAADLIPFKELYSFLLRPSPALPPENPESWNAQVFRSIDGGVVSGFPQKPAEAAALGLVTGKDAIIDRSIQDAYINAIRRAKNFVYIENQYFLGSSFAWRPEESFKVEDIGALHLVPKELSLKIASKIDAGERFAVYVVIPMWPEGEPESAAVQAILDWQRRTIEMMYADVAGAIRRKGIDAHPRDYLTFFCLGNRETARPGEYVPPETPPPDSDYERAQQSRRFMTYVHAKMMIVDDEYIILGSANINQRSMDGGRDSEIAMGAYQPHHLAKEGPAMGHIYGFRMALWWEHLSVLDELFTQPEKVECVRRVNDLAGENWAHYVRETFDKDLPGHLLRYPLDVDDNGMVRPLPGVEFFPDTKARVVGTRSDQLPAILTT